MWVIRTLLIKLLAVSPFITHAQSGLRALPVESDQCSIYHALTGQIMPGCERHSPQGRIVRSTGAPDANGYVIHFEFDSRNLKIAERDHLMRLSNLLTGPLAHLCVKLVGHTDTSGSSQYNQALSVKRAQSVRLFMVGPGMLQSNRILAEGRGEQFPISGLPGDDAQNRRVEVLAKETPTGQCR